MAVIPAIRLVPHIAGILVCERQLRQPPRLAPVGNRSLDLNVAENFEVEEESLQSGFEIVSNPVELLHGVVADFEKSILAPVGGPEVGGEEFFKNFLRPVLIGLPDIMSVL